MDMFLGALLLCYILVFIFLLCVSITELSKGKWGWNDFAYSVVLLIISPVSMGFILNAVYKRCTE